LRNRSKEGFQDTVTLFDGKELVRRHIDLAWNEADFDRLDEVWSPDAVVHLANGRDVVGLSELKAHLATVVLVWEQRECRIEELLAERDLVANRWSFRAVGKDGPALSMTGMDFYRTANGKLVEEWIALGIPQ
jgi:ketosteroid isomerase-like protein